MSEADSVDRPNSSAEEDEQPVQKTEEVPDSTDTPQQRAAKKAQRTKRVEVKTAQNANKSKSKPANKPSSNDQSEEVCEDAEGEENGDDAAKIIQGILIVMEKVFRVLLACVMVGCRLLCGALRLARGVMAPAMGAAMFALVAYVIGTYVMSPVSQADVPNFDARLKFLLRCQVWPTLPVLLAALAGFFRRTEVHKTFARDVFEQALLSLFNLLLLATHLHTDCLLWVGACAVTTTIFSLLHWLCLVYTRRPGSLFALPGTLLNFGVMAYNIYVIFGQDLGYVPSPPEHDVTTPRSQGKPSYWDHVTMCHLMEQMFCKVD